MANNLNKNRSVKILKYLCIFLTNTILILVTKNVLAQNSLEVALQIGHHKSTTFNSAPHIYAISNDDRWVITSDNTEHTLIVWEIKIGKIYATYPIQYPINSAAFLTNNEDVLINKSFIFNIHTGKTTRQLSDLSITGGEMDIKRDFSVSDNKLVYAVVRKDSFENSLEKQYNGYQKGFCTDSLHTIFWGFEHDRIYEYNVADGTAKRSINPQVDQIVEITYHPRQGILSVQGQTKTCYFKTNGVLQFNYISEALLNIRFSKNMQYLSGLKLSRQGNVGNLHVWSIGSQPQLIIDKGPYNGVVTASFIDGDSCVLVYSENPTTKKTNAKAINISSGQVVWEDDKDDDYRLSPTGNYLVASYQFDRVKVFSTKDFRVLNDGNNSQVSMALISPDEEYAVQQEKDAGSRSEKVVVYKLPEFTPLYTKIRDSVTFLSRFDRMGLLISPDSKEVYLYKEKNKLIGRFDVNKNSMKRDSLALPVRSDNSLCFSVDGQYLIDQEYGSVPYIYDAKSLRAFSNKEIKKICSFTTAVPKNIFTLYQSSEKENIINVENISDGGAFKVVVNNYLLTLNCNKEGDRFAYGTYKISGYHLAKRIYIIDVNTRSVTDSLDLPDTETDVKGQLIFSNDNSKLYIGFNNLYEYNIGTKELKKISPETGTKYYPVNQSDNSTFLFTYSPQKSLEGAKLAVIDISNQKVALEASSRLYSYLLSDITYSFMKGYPNLFETELNYKPYFINTADKVPYLRGLANINQLPFALTHDGSKQLNVSWYNGLEIYSSSNFKLLNTIGTGDYSNVGFTLNKKYALNYDNPALGGLLNVYDVQKGFKKVPFIYSSGKTGEFRIYNDVPLYIYEQMLLSPNGTYFATLDSYGEGAVNVYKFDTGELLYNHKAPYLSNKDQKVIKNEWGTSPNFLYHLYISENEKYILFDTYRGFMIKADFVNKKEQRLAYPSKQFATITISKSGNWVVAVNSDVNNHLLMVWDSSANARQIPLKLNSDDLSRLKIEIHEQQKVLSLQTADGLCFYDLNTLQLIKQFTDPLITTESDEDTQTIKIKFSNNKTIKYTLPDFRLSSITDKSGQYRFGKEGQFQCIIKDSTVIARYLFDATNKQIMWYTPGNYYFVNKASKDVVAFRTHHNLYPTSTFDAEFNRPDTVLNILDPVFHFDPEVLKVYSTAYNKRLQNSKINDVNKLDNLPEVQITPLIKDENTANKNFKITLKSSGKNQQIAAYNILVNGVPLFGKKGHKVNTSELNQQINVPLLPGKNVIEASVTNSIGQRSLPAIVVEYLTDSTLIKPKTYFIGVGISKYKNTDQNLEYAAKDIEDFTLAIRKKNPDAIIKTFLNESATREHILGLRDSLLKTNTEDKVLFYYCGHGIRKQNYYIGTYAFEFANPAKDGIDINEVYNLLDSIPARSKFIVLDACNSGQFYGLTSSSDSTKKVASQIGDPNVKVISAKLSRGAGATKQNSNAASLTVDEVMDDIFADFGNDYGIDVLAATKGAEVAYETPEFKNGIFTHAMLQAINTNLDGYYNNKPITMSSLKNYVTNMVVKLTGSKQVPVSRNENTMLDWVVW